MDILVRANSDLSQTIVRGEVVSNNRNILLEGALSQSGRSVFQVNRQRINRGELLGLIPISVFMPDDLELIKGGPSERRRYLDNGLIQINPRLNTVRSNVENILRQRNALLRQSKGKLNPEVTTTLDVWDEKLVEVAEQLADARRNLVLQLGPKVSASYAEISGQVSPIEISYKSTWLPGNLNDILQQVRHEDLHRGISTVGPHRDDMLINLDKQPARTHASQGEQRLLALALRLAIHRELAEATGESPVLLLDDVFSELDLDRSRGVLGALESEQTLLTTAGVLPSEVTYDARFQVFDGQIIREV